MALNRFCLKICTFSNELMLCKIQAPLLNQSVKLYHEDTSADDEYSSYSSNNESHHVENLRGFDDKVYLGRMSFADVQVFQGKRLVHIRKYYEKDGELKPSPKGISLQPYEWERLKQNTGLIDKKLEELKLHTTYM